MQPGRALEAERMRFAQLGFFTGRAKRADSSGGRFSVGPVIASPYAALRSDQHSRRGARGEARPSQFRGGQAALFGIAPGCNPFRSGLTTELTRVVCSKLSKRNTDRSWMT